MPTYGRIDEYDSKKEEWPQYVERLNHFFVVNAITDAERKRAILLTVIGPASFKLLRSLLHPTKLEDKSFKELSDALAAHYKPTPSETVQRFKFHTRCRKQGESVATYVSELRALAEYCNFGNLEEMLRDRLVCGINHERTQNRLLSEAKLTYEKALEIAQSQETAAQNLQELKSTPMAKEEASFTDKNKPVLTVAKKGKRKVTCYRCGQEGHLANKCKFIEAECRKCGKKGHLQASCASSYTGYNYNHCYYTRSCVDSGSYPCSTSQKGVSSQKQETA